MCSRGLYRVLVARRTLYRRENLKPLNNANFYTSSHFLHCYEMSYKGRSRANWKALYYEFQ